MKVKIAGIIVALIVVSVFLVGANVDPQNIKSQLICHKGNSTVTDLSLIHI